ncbi:MAG: hypothetical protein J6C44_10075 [Muribaculaceae bacterium]|nr:hypothetical protein [Muribaculaceae bacterium]
MNIRRCGNFGFVENGAGEVYTFSIGASTGSGWTPTSYMLRGGGLCSFGYKYMSVNGTPVIPFGVDNDLPGHVSRLLEKFYAGEGIMGKKAGLQWGEGPRLYRDAVDLNNLYYRHWAIDDAITAELKVADYLTQMHRCLIDLCHLEGFWVMFIRNRGPRIGGAGRLVKVEHIPARKCRFVWEGENVPPTRVMVGDFPSPDASTSRIYPLFDPSNPLKHPVSIGYFNIYSYNHDHYSVPRFIGAFDWLELAGTLAPLLSTYNANASAISKHIESPQSYWDKAEEKIKDACQRRGIPYKSKYLEDYKDEAMEKFATQMSGKENAGKFLHTSRFYNEVASDFEGWKITPIDNKVKEYIEAQVAICKKAEAAATSGFGLDPSLSNLILDTKLGSGSEKLYALKVYNATETSVADMVLCKPWQYFLEVNHPGTDLKIGLYRTVVEAEKNVNPENRIKANA